MNIPGAGHNSEPYLPEISREKAIKIALGVAVAAGLYHHFSKNRRGYIYIRPSKSGLFNWEVGIADHSGDVRQLFGSAEAPGGSIDRLGEAEDKNIVIDDEASHGVSAAEIHDAFAPEIDDA